MEVLEDPNGRSHLGQDLVEDSSRGRCLEIETENETKSGLEDVTTAQKLLGVST